MGAGAAFGNNADRRTVTNHEHLHSGIGFVSPADRHEGYSDGILARRKAVYKAARRRNPARWSRDIRAWDAPSEVVLNPAKDPVLKAVDNAVAA
jgi:hypothetical protein